MINLKKILPRSFRGKLMYALKFLPDELYIKLFYFSISGKWLDLKNPKGFNEKQNWLKLHDRHDEYGELVDKYAMRKHIDEALADMDKQTMKELKNSPKSEKLSENDVKDAPGLGEVSLNNKAYKAVINFLNLLKNNKKCTNEEIENTLVIKALDSIISDPKQQFIKTLNKGKPLYRCRDVNSFGKKRNDGITAKCDGEKWQFTGYNDMNSKEAPLNAANAGRANIKGVSYLYTATDPYTACAEIQPKNRSTVSCATFLLEKDVHLISLQERTMVKGFEDFEAENKVPICSVLSAIIRFFQYSDIDESIYAFTQIISDYCRKAGFDGIMYQSVITEGENVVLFNCHKSIVKFQSSKLFFVRTRHFDIFDLNSGERQDEPVKVQCNESELQYVRKQLYNEINNCEKVKRNDNSN